MSEAPRIWSPVRITDARRRRVLPLDPILMQVRGEHDVIDAETLRAITAEVGTGLQKWPRRALLFGVIVVGAVLLAVGVRAFVVGGLPAATAWLVQRLRVLLIITAALVGLWLTARQVRLGRVKRAMLAHRRCPHCGYDLRGLPADPGDGATVCPECGCAWEIKHPVQSPS